MGIDGGGRCHDGIKAWLSRMYRKLSFGVKDFVILADMLNSLITFNPVIKEVYPDAKVGMLVIEGVDNKAGMAALDGPKATVQAELRAKFKGISRNELDQMTVLKEYGEYYRNFGKTYHVRLQLESVVGGKDIPMISPLVTSMFLAEMKNQILTAGHDLDLLDLPLDVSVGLGSEEYLMMSGQEQVIRAEDLFIADRLGVISSIIYGPDKRTKITAKTSRVVYTTYMPGGIGEEAAMAHLEDLAGYVQMVDAGARVELLDVIG
jgi:DNA/RNA-binding domain of Phe-tRNA-synthetase-like protein